MHLRAVARNSVVAAAYTGLFYACYVGFLHRWFDYAGFSLYERDVWFIALSFTLAVAPVVFHRSSVRIAGVISVFIYLLLYVPIVLTFGLGSAALEGQILLIQTVFAVSMTLIFLADWFVIANPLDLHTRAHLVKWALIVVLASTGYMFLVYRGSLRFASFGADIYVQRLAVRDIGTDVVTRYLGTWLANVFVPLCLAHGLVARKPLYFAVGTAACMLMFAVSASKAIILFPVVFAAFYWVFRNGRLTLLFPIFGIGLFAFVGALFVFGSDVESTIFLAASILIYRTIGNGGQLTMTYYDFFNTYPQTSYSHVKGIKQLTGAYPYGSLDIGQVIGQFYFGTETNANANFWATDGFAAMGLVGVLVATAVCVLLCVLLNSITRGYDQLFVALCFIPFLTQLLNTSLFTSVWSGGALFLALFFILNTQAASRSSSRVGAPSS
jgi:hypothetical protein